MPTNHFLAKLLTLTGLLFHLFAGGVEAAQLLRITQSVDKTQASIRYWEPVTYTFNYSNSSLTASALGGYIEDTLPLNMEFLSLSQTAHVASTNYNAATRKVTINFISPLPAGAVGSVSITARFLQTTAGNYTTTNTGTVRGTNSDTMTSNAVTVTAINPVPPPPGIVYDSKLLATKTTANTETSQNYGWLTYYITHGNSYPNGQALPGYKITENFPANAGLSYVRAEAYSAASAAVNIFYKTNQNGTLRAWPGNPRYTTGSYTYAWPSELGLAANEYVSGLEFRYTGMVGGGGFHPSNMTSPLTIGTRIVNPAAASEGSTVTNCASVSTSATSPVTSCVNSTITKSRPTLHAYFSWPYNSPYPPFATNQEFKLAMTLANQDTSTGSIMNPKVGILIPATFDYVGFDSLTASGNVDVSSIPAPQVQVINNYQNNGSTFVKYLWGTSNPMTISNSTDWKHVNVVFKVRPKATTANGSYPFQGYINLDTSYQIVTSSTSSCTSSIFKNYNVITRNKFKTNSDIEGRLMTKEYDGNQSTTLAKNLFGWASNDQSVQVQNSVVNGGPLNLQYGSFYVSSVAAMNSRTVNYNGGGSLQTSGGPDFNGTFAGIQIASGIYELLSANSTVSIPSSPGPATLQIGSNLGAGNVAVFNISGNDLLSNSNVQQIDINLNGKNPNAIIINCSGSSVTLDRNFVGGMQSAGLRPRILWNCPNASTVALNASLYGSLLAPNASVVATGGAVEGSVYAKDLDASIEVHLPVFTGTVCPASSSTTNVVEDGVPYLSWTEQDATDWDADGNSAEFTGRGYTEVAVETNGKQPAITAVMSVIGELDSTGKISPDTALTTPSGKADYTLNFTNEGGVAVKNLVVINILPHVGDKGVIDTTARGSTFSPYLAAPITAPNATTYYSTVGNPCRNELTPGIPVGCSPPNWTNVPPADLTTVKSLKLDFGNTVVWPSQTLAVSWPMRVPITAPTGATDVAWNSFGFVVSRQDNGQKMLPSEPRMTGVKVQPPLPPFYGDRVWLDTNKNGIQNTGESGINGIRVDLYRDNGDGVRDIVTDTFVKFTTTAGGGLYRFANMGPGNYYAIVQVPNTYGISPLNQGTNDAVDSDGEATQIAGGRTALMPITNLAIGESDLTWDQGLFDKSNTPAVWASEPMSDGKIYIGGRFNSVAGITRKNIARLTNSGAVDTKFVPGTGFNNDVMSLSALGSGAVAAGGKFTNFNGATASGLAIVTAEGTAISNVCLPDTPDVRWVYATGSQIYFAGKFFSVNGIERDGIARMSTSGALDTGFDTSNGANDAVNDAKVLPDGSVIAVGKFTTYAGLPRSGVVKLNADGSIAQNFDVGTGANNEVLSVKVIADGRIIISGRFTQFNGMTARGTMRLEPSGAVDPSMQAHDLDVNSINSMN